MPSDMELGLRLLAAALLGAVVGLERELTDKSAGLRTHISVALGAALFTVVSAYGFEEFGNLGRNESSYQVDVTRVASNVVTGVGFLGGGAILKYGGSVRGLTTAASLWVTAAIGLAVGMGSYRAAGVSAAVLMVALVGLRGPRRWIEGHLARRADVIELTLAKGASVGEVVDALHRMDGLEIKSLSLHRTEEGAIVRADVRTGKGVDVHAELRELLDHPGVVEVDVTR